MKDTMMQGRSNRGWMNRAGNRRRGVALPIAMLLMTLLMGMGIAMVIAVSSDLFINTFYRGNRASYYGSDSGLNIVRRDMENRMVAAAPLAFPAGTPPMPVGTEAVVQAALLGTYGAFRSITTPVPGTIQTQPSRFRLDSLTLVLAPGVPPGGIVTAVGPGPAFAPTAYRYVYNYTMQTTGQSQGTEDMRLQEIGQLTLNAAIAPGGPQVVSFASWGFFVDNQPVCSGSTLVPGTVTGPVHSNGGWTFGTSGAYTFTDPITQVNPNMGFQFAGACLQNGTAPVSRAGVTINPQFQAGMSTNVPTVLLPTNDFSQQRAVLDGLGTNVAPVTSAERNAELKLVNAASYPLGAPPATGVYIPYDSATNTVTGSGIHVAGNASVVMSTVGASGQRFQITQGGTVTTITVDPVLNTTIITSGATTRTLTGVFTDMISTPNKPATMLYVDGEITGLRGPAQGVPAVQDAAAVTITAKTHVTVTGDLLYKTPPITKTANEPCCPGTPAGTLIPGNDNKQVLGIFTNGGDIRLNNGQANRMLEIDASMATLASGGTGGVINVGAAINTLNIIGGRIQNNIKNINTTTRNVLFDRRFASNGFAPSWFPSTSITAPGGATATYTSTATRQRWFNETQK